MHDTHETDGQQSRAVSPVIGVILMVAITVILASVIAAFVLGLGDTDEPAPTPSLEFSENESHVMIDITGGDTFEAGYVEVSGDNVTEGMLHSAAANDIDETDELQAGDEIVLDRDPDGSPWEVQLIWSPPGENPEIIADASS